MLSPLSGFMKILLLLLCGRLETASGKWPKRLLLKGIFFKTKISSKTTFPLNSQDGGGSGAPLGSLLSPRHMFRGVHLLSFRKEVLTLTGCSDLRLLMVKPNK